MARSRFSLRFWSCFCCFKHKKSFFFGVWQKKAVEYSRWPKYMYSFCLVAESFSHFLHYKTAFSFIWPCTWDKKYICKLKYNFWFGLHQCWWCGWVGNIFFVFDQIVLGLFYDFVAFIIVLFWMLGRLCRLFFVWGYLTALSYGFKGSNLIWMILFNFSEQHAVKEGNSESFLKNPKNWADKQDFWEISINI
jgi:hypothetical protein